MGERGGGWQEALESARRPSVRGEVRELARAFRGAIDSAPALSRAALRTNVFGTVHIFDGREDVL